MPAFECDFRRVGEVSGNLLQFPCNLHIFSRSNKSDGIKQIKVGGCLQNLIFEYYEVNFKKPLVAPLIYLNC